MEAVAATIQEVTSPKFLAEVWDRLSGMSMELAIVLGALGVGFVLQFAVMFVLKRLLRHDLHRQMLAKLRAPMRLLAPLVAGLFAMFLLQLRLSESGIVRDTLIIGMVPLIGWLASRCVIAGEMLVLSHYKLDGKRNLLARKMHTQVRFFRRMVNGILFVLTFAATLMLFDRFRQLGTSLLASAGVVGVIVGVSAQRLLANVLVGLQLATTQPVRLDDVLIIEGEWGRVEEITSTYVVLRIWDQRRLIVPLTHFVEKPFQNWTRVSSDLLGTVFLYLDYSTPIEPLRQELTRLLEASTLWDKRVNGIQVTGASAQAMEVRALMSAADSSEVWDLRCHVREALIAFLQANYPDSFPRVRLEPIGGDPMARQEGPGNPLREI